MRGYFTVLMLIILAVSAGLAASRVHAAPVPECELLAINTVHAQYPLTVGALENVECVALRNGAFPVKICEMTAKNDEGFRYSVTMPLTGPSGNECKSVHAVERTKIESRASVDDLRNQ